jgi:hypothetical protein
MKDFDQEDLHLKIGENSEGEFWISHIQKRFCGIFLIKEGELKFSHRFELINNGAIFNCGVDGEIIDFEFYIKKILTPNFTNMWSCYTLLNYEMEFWSEIEKLKNVTYDIDRTNENSNYSYSICLGDKSITSKILNIKPLNDDDRFCFDMLRGGYSFYLMDNDMELGVTDIPSEEGGTGIKILSYKGNVIAIMNDSIDKYSYISYNLMNKFFEFCNSKKRITPTGKIKL